MKTVIVFLFFILLSVTMYASAREGETSSEDEKSFQIWKLLIHKQEKKMSFPINEDYPAYFSSKKSCEDRGYEEVLNQLASQLYDGVDFECYQLL